MAGLTGVYRNNRLAYDVDGTRLFLGATLRQDLLPLVNDENPLNGASALDSIQDWTFVFPMPRRIQGLYLFTGGITTFSVSVSLDATDGTHGTYSVPQVMNTAPAPEPHVGINYFDFGVCSAVKITTITGAVGMVHLFGSPPADALVLWHTTFDRQVDPSYFDFGTVIPGTSQDLLFRVKNVSSVLTATSVQVTVSTLTDTTPSVAAQHMFCAPGDTVFRARVDVGDLSPGSVSDQVTIRRVTALSAVRGSWSGRVVVSTSLWSAGHYSVATLVSPI